MATPEQLEKFRQFQKEYAEKSEIAKAREEEILKQRDAHKNDIKPESNTSFNIVAVGGTDGIQPTTPGKTPKPREERKAAQKPASDLAQKIIELKKAKGEKK